MCGEKNVRGAVEYATAPRYCTAVRVLIAVAVDDLVAGAR
jgi:hypothetical protein